MASSARSYEQVARQLKEQIVSGELATDEQLPPEVELARLFATSRNTVREALRMLTSQGLLATRPGHGGGSRVVQPTTEGVTNYLQSAFALWVDAEALGLEDLFEARELLEVHAARRAAALSADRADEALAPYATADLESADLEEILTIDRSFHEAVFGLAGNRFLRACTLPIYTVLASRVERSLIHDSFWQEVAEQHRGVLAAISSGDEQQSAQLMMEHVRSVRRAYESARRSEEQ